MIRWSFYLIATCFLFSCANDRDQNSVPDDHSNVFAPAEQIKAILPLYDSIDPKSPGDWILAKDEPSLSFEEYIMKGPVRADSVRKVIYVKPIGRFDSTQYDVLDITARFLSTVYHKWVQVQDPTSVDTFPKRAFRQGQIGLQLNTGFVMKQYLRPKLPADAVVYIALTTVDLFPSEDWNFVFGQSMIKGRVGVWSVRRLCDGHAYPTDSLCVMRTLKVAVHEVGHMFSIHHCRNFHCVMNGSMSLEESDLKPAYFCPECLQKLCWNNAQRMEDHFRAMIRFWSEAGHEPLAEFYRMNLKRVSPTQ